MFKRYSRKKNSIHIISLSCNTVPPVNYGGIELVVAHLSEGLAKLSANVICYSPGTCSVEGIRHIQTLSQPSAPFSESGISNSQEHLRSTASHLQKNVQRGDIILFNHPEQFRWLKKVMGRLFWLTVNTYEIAHWLDVGLYKNIIYPSGKLQADINKRGWMIPHGQKLMYAEGEQKRDRHLFFAGRITKDKGVDIAMEACKKLGIQLRLAGPTPDQAFADTILNDDQVNYIGNISYLQLFKEYQNCAAVVYMTQYNEPFGLTAVEAMAAGAPVITTGFGGTGETVLNGQTGFFCSNSEDIVAAYAKLPSISQLACIDRAKEYSHHNMARKYLDLFEGRPPSAVEK